MADEQNPNPTPVPDPAAPVPAALERPASIPETLWDAEKNLPKWDDLSAAVTERDALKTAVAERAAKIPATADAYALSLPSDFELPAGYKWEADPKDPLVAGVREFAATNKLTQDEVGGLVKLYASVEAKKVSAQQEFLAEQTKALGEKATERRAAAATYIDSIFTKDDPKGAILKTMLDYAPGVEALEAIIAKAGIQTRGNPGGDPPKENPAAKKLSNMYPTMAGKAA